MKTFRDRKHALKLFNIIALLGVAAVGSGQASTYSAAAASINVTPSPLSFGTRSVGSSTSLSEKVTNPGSKRIVLTGAQVQGTGLKITSHPLFPYPLGSGSSVAFTVRFIPPSSGSFQGSMTVHYKYASGGGWKWTSVTVQVSGTGGSSGGSLTANPATLSFNGVAVGTSNTLAETLTNTESTAVTISNIAVTGTGYSYSGINPPATLSPGQSASFNISFAPKSAGSVSGNLTVSSNAYNPTMSVPLTGTGTAIGQIGVSPASASFGSVVVGSNKSMTGTVNASGGTVTVSGASSSGTEFSVSGLKFPFTLNAGQSASYSLVFAPTASGSTSANITWQSNATNPSPTESLTGTGTPPPAHSVTLNWTASPSSGVVGYNIYRGGNSGGPYSQINSAVDTTTQDVDYSVVGGQTYYYVVTAVNSAGAESTYSNQIQAVIPYP